MNVNESQRLFAEAQHHIPGGVNSPVRAFKAVGGDPLFIKSAEGAYLHDEDGNSYIELINSWGPMILGHGNEDIKAAVNAAISNSLSFGAPTAAWRPLAIRCFLTICPFSHPAPVRGV